MPAKKDPKDSSTEDPNQQQQPSTPSPPPPSVLDELYSAVIHGKEDVVSQLLTRNNANYSDPLKQLTLLMWAVEANELGIAELLLKKGARQHLTDPSGYTALHRAAFKKKEAMTRLLLKYDASIENLNRASVGGARRTPLILAAMQGSDGVVNAILDAIKAVEQQQQQQISTTSQRQQQQQQFSKSSVSTSVLSFVVDTRDSTGMSAIDHVGFRGFESIVKVLAEHGASCNATLYFAGDGARHAVTTEQKSKYEGLLKYLYSPWAEQSVVTP